MTGIGDFEPGVSGNPDNPGVGPAGRGIIKVEKTNTSGRVDTYTFTYSDGTTSTYTLTNGADGSAGRGISDLSKIGTVGRVDTYRLTFTDGSTFDFPVTNGADGAPGSGGGGSAAPSLQRTMFNTGMAQLASNNAPANTGQQSEGGRWSRVAHVILRAGYEWRIVYANWSVSQATPFDSPGNNPIAVRSAIEVVLDAQVGVGAMGGFKRVVSTGSIAWQTTQAYNAGDGVTYQGATYCAKGAIAANASPPGSNNLWGANTTIPVHFPGEGANREIVIQPGQFAVSEPFGAELAAGTVIYSSNYVRPNNGTDATGGFGTNVQCVGGIDTIVRATAAGTPPVDYTINPPPGPVPPSLDDTTYGPVAILGIPRAGVAGTPVWVYSGDSIADFAGSPNNGNEGGSWAMMALYDIPHVRLTRAGDGLFKWFQAGTRFIASTRHRLDMWAGTHLICQFGANDIGSGSFTVLSVYQAAQIRYWQMGVDRGMKVWQATAMPETESTDGWTTIANQTPSGGAWGPGGLAEKDIDWLRDGAPILNGVAVAVGSTATGTLRCRYLSRDGVSAERSDWSPLHPLVGVIDTAYQVADPTVRWAWRPGYTETNKHPNGTGHRAGALAVDRSKFLTV